MKFLTGLRAALFVIVAAASAIPAHAQCYTFQLVGDYSIRISGTITAGPLAGLASGLNRTHFDGSGNLTSVDHVSHAGVQPAAEWRPSTGVYVVNPDCTGKATLTFTDGQPPLTFYFILSNRGSFDIVVGNAGTNILAVATRLN
jgi:hypothetical protein